MLSRFKLSRIIKYGLVILAIWLVYVMLYPSWTEIETWEHLKAVQRSHKKFVDAQEKLEFEEDGKSQGKHPNALDSLPVKKKKKLTLQERLKPKLAGALPSVNDEGDVVWDDIGVAKSPEDVQLRDDGYKKFAFNSLVSSRIGFQREIPDTR